MVLFLVMFIKRIMSWYSFGVTGLIWNCLMSVVFLNWYILIFRYIVIFCDSCPDHCYYVIVNKIVKIWKATDLLWLCVQTSSTCNSNACITGADRLSWNAIPIEYNILLLYHWTIELRILKCIIVLVMASRLSES